MGVSREQDGAIAKAYFNPGFSGSFPASIVPDPIGGASPDVDINQLPIF
jgi:hypothetical protein